MAVKRSPQTIETIIVNVGYSTGYGRSTAQNLQPSIFEGCRFAAVSQNTANANQFAFALEY